MIEGAEADMMRLDPTHRDHAGCPWRRQPRHVAEGWHVRLRYCRVCESTSHEWLNLSASGIAVIRTDLGRVPR